MSENNMRHGGLRVSDKKLPSSRSEFPLVSIVTVTRNSFKTVERTIRSILAQTYPNIEYIIVDGESEDGTIEIIKKYESKISYWLSEKDQNLYDAMNKGIALATGDIVGIVNSDDWLEIDAVENVADAFVKNPFVDLVHGNLNSRKENGDLECVLKPRLSKFSFYISLPYYHPTCFLRKRVYEKYGVFNIDYSIVADYEFVLRLNKKGIGIKYIDKVISNMTCGGVSNRPTNFQKAMEQSLRAKLLNGYNPILSCLGLFVHKAKYYSYGIIRKCGLDFLVRLYRLLYK